MVRRIQGEFDGIYCHAPRRRKLKGVTCVRELKGRYVRNCPKLFGADELPDKKDQETKLIATLRTLVARRGESYGI